MTFADVLDTLGTARDRTLGIVAHLDDAELEAVIDPIMSPLAWDLGHIAAYEDLWINHRRGGRDLLRSDLAVLYDAFETPRRVRGGLRFLRGDHLRDYLDEVRRRAMEVDPGDGLLHELVARHELQHAETMLQSMRLGGLLPEGVFGYDNERPRHDVAVPSFSVGSTPVTNATWLHFCEGGGYVRREWWSREGWAWKEDHDITHHAGAEAGDPDAPVVHVSWFEADAFARAHDMRLPTEVEWEKAATSGQIEGTGQVWEWTASPFAAYDGFVAHPYREYSEPFFGDRYRVLRGGSCATDERVMSPHFRNWDLPERRQLFAGLRLAA